MKFKWRKWNRATHRDLGYLFVAMTIIYSLSGIAINHLNDWNPNYVITVEDIQVQIPSDKSKIDKKEVINILSQIGEEDNYKKHYFPGNSQLKVFIDGGNTIIDLATGEGIIEKIKRRPLFCITTQVNGGQYSLTYLLELSSFYPLQDYLLFVVKMELSDVVLSLHLLVLYCQSFTLCFFINKFFLSDFFYNLQAIKN